jgi:hypothetical protein
MSLYTNVKIGGGGGGGKEKLNPRPNVFLKYLLGKKPLQKFFC